MGSSSSGTSTSTSTEIDNRVFNLEGASGLNLTDIDSGGGDVTMTDFGAVAGALDLGESVVETLAEFGGDALEQNSNILKQQTFSNTQNLQALKDFATEVQTGGQLEISKAMKVVAVSVVVVTGLVVIVVSSRGKK
tara:strand:+ start:6535 stop:6942 length:408 start_codon:yes stop_codon:yes gene_type:complete